MSPANRLFFVIQSAIENLNAVVVIKFAKQGIISLNLFQAACHAQQTAAEHRARVHLACQAHLLGHGVAG